MTWLNWFENYRENRRLREANRMLQMEAAHLRRETEEWRRFFPPGHFYSPIASREEISEAFRRGIAGPPFPGVDLNEQAQIALLDVFARYYPEHPFAEEPSADRRFYLNNPSYGHFDALMLYSMLRHETPRRIIEVGSGFSSAAMLDLNETIFDSAVRLTFIDPDMSRLRPLLRSGDDQCVALIEQRVQEVPLEVFSELEAGDVLFIDSSHVSKIGSDVNRLYFEVLPVLRPGVRVHIHDVAGNLEYPREWLEEGRAWNEQYLIRAFLMYNNLWRIDLLSGWLYNTKHAFMRETMPLCTRGGGGQIWIRRIAT